MQKLFITSPNRGLLREVYILRRLAQGIREALQTLDFAARNKVEQETTEPGRTEIAQEWGDFPNYWCSIHRGPRKEPHELISSHADGHTMCGKHKLQCLDDLRKIVLRLGHQGIEGIAEAAPPDELEGGASHPRENVEILSRPVLDL